MKNKLKLIISSAVMLVALLFPLQTVSAATTDVFDNNPGCTSSTGSQVCGDKSGSGLFSVIKVIIQTLLTVGGIIAVIMIILGGIRYITSNGDQADVKAAKDTILYAVIGLVITIGAFAVVTWVVGKF